MPLGISTGTECCCCGNDEAFIAVGKRNGNFTFSDLISNQVCWDCYVAVIHPVDRKLANAKARLEKLIDPNAPNWRLALSRRNRDRRNIEAWEEAIRLKQAQRQFYGIC